MERLEYRTIGALNGPVIEGGARTSFVPDQIPVTSLEALELSTRAKAADSLMGAAHMNPNFQELFDRSGMRVGEYWESLLDAPSMVNDATAYVVRVGDPSQVMDAILKVVDSDDARSILDSAIETFENEDERQILQGLSIPSNVDQDRPQVEGRKAILVALGHFAMREEKPTIENAAAWTKTRKSGISRGPGSRRGQARRNNGRGWGIFNGAK